MGARITGLSEFVKLTKETPEVIGRTADSVLKQEARGLCVNLGASTQPGGYKGGLAEGPVKAFEDSIKQQVHRVFAVKGEKARLVALVARRSSKLAAGYARAVREGNEAQQRRYLREAGISIEALDPRVHKAARTGPGRSVPKKQAVQAVVPVNQYRRYAREKGETAGLAKAAWYAAAKGIGGRVRRNLVDAGGKRKTEEIFPGRLRKLARKFPGIGGARVTFLRVEVFSNVSYASEALPQELHERAVTSAREQLGRSLRMSVVALRRRRWKVGA